MSSISGTPKPRRRHGIDLCRRSGGASALHGTFLPRPRRCREERLPRYTSYPTPPHFSDTISQQTYREWLASILEDRTVSIYLHIPFCRSMCWYCGCNTTIARREEPIAEYLAALRREIDVVTSHVAGPLQVGQVHFGGGTLTIVTPAQFAELMKLKPRIGRIRLSNVP